MALKVRCKFKCGVVKQVSGYDGKVLYGVEMYPVTDTTRHNADGTKDTPSEENKKFFSATPSGKIEFNSINEGGFECGKEYYIDITPAD